MRLYNQELTHGLLLAPLSGYTNWPMRMLCRRYGAEIAFTEMLSTAGLVRNDLNTTRLTIRPPEDRPLIAQIFSNQPAEATLAARMLEDMGFDGIDINMGCPVKKVVAKGCGAGLMRMHETAEALVQAVLKAVTIPVSVKMRAGWDSASLNADQLSSRLSEVRAGLQPPPDAGLNCIILHPRTRSQMYQGQPHWQMLTRVRQITTLPLVASGDIKSARDRDALLAMGADACMIGRGAVGRPWIFREVLGLAGPDFSERRDCMLEHLDLICGLLGEVKGVRWMRKFLSGYVKGLDGATHFRQLSACIDTHSTLEDSIRSYFQRIMM